MKLASVEGPAAVERAPSRRESEREPAEGAFAALLVPVEAPPMESRPVSLSGSSQEDTGSSQEDTGEGAEIRPEEAGSTKGSPGSSTQDLGAESPARAALPIRDARAQELAIQQLAAQVGAMESGASGVSAASVSAQVGAMESGASGLTAGETQASRARAAEIGDATPRDAEGAEASGQLVRGGARVPASLDATGAAARAKAAGPQANTSAIDLPPTSAAPSPTSTPGEAQTPPQAAEPSATPAVPAPRPDGGTRRGLRLGVVSEPSARPSTPHSISSGSVADARRQATEPTPAPTPTPAAPGLSSAPQAVALATSVTLDAKSRQDDARSRLLDSIADKIVSTLDSSPRTSAASEARAPAAPRAASPFAPPSVLRAEVIADVRMSVLAGQAGTAVQIEHPDFGRIQLQLRMRAGSLELRALTNDLGASMAIRASESLLRERVARRGVSLGSVRVSTRDKTKHRRVTRKRGLDMEA